MAILFAFSVSAVVLAFLLFHVVVYLDCVDVKAAAFKNLSYCPVLKSLSNLAGMGKVFLFLGVKTSSLMRR